MASMYQSPSQESGCTSQTWMCIHMNCLENLLTCRFWLHGSEILYFKHGLRWDWCCWSVDHNLRSKEVDPNSIAPKAIHTGPSLVLTDGTSYGASHFKDSFELFYSSDVNNFKANSCGKTIVQIWPVGIGPSMFSLYRIWLCFSW